MIRMKMKNAVIKTAVWSGVLVLTFHQTEWKTIAAELSKGEYEKAQTAENLLEMTDGIFSWKKSQEGICKDEPLLSGDMVQYAGSSDLDWYAFAMARCGYEDDYESYGVALKEQIVEKYKTEEKLDENSATEWHRQILTLLSVGEDPQEITADMGTVIHLVADGTYDRGKTKSLGEQGLNGYIWALIALDSGPYPVPEDASDTREDILSVILESQNADGGFSLTKGESDVDMTAMALQAMTPYVTEKTTFAEVVSVHPELTRKVAEAVERAVSYLSEHQFDNGAMGNGEASAESTAQVITALCSLNIDLKQDERFIRDGKNLIDAITLFRNADGGFSHLLDEEERESNSLVGEQTAIALGAYIRFCLGENSMYDIGGADAGEGTTENAAEPENIKEHPLLQQYRQLKDKIGSINTQIQKSLYPFEDMSGEDKKLAAELLAAVKELPDYAQEDILEYEKLCQAAKDAGSHAVPVLVLTVVAAGSLLAGGIIYIGRKKRSV